MHRKYLTLLLAGVLSVFYAEVLSGASILWFLDPFGYIILLPLYMFHLIVLYNIAVRFQRLSPKALYMFGVIFGMYETWITKVAWAGFSASEKPMFGRFLGFAVGELGIVTFFWHPFMSFIAPIVTLQILSASAGNKESLSYPWTTSFLSKQKINLFFYFAIAFFSASAVALNSSLNIVVALVGFLGTLSIVYTLYRAIIGTNPKLLSLDNLIIGKKAFVFMLVYLGAIYGLFFVSVRTEAIPSTPTILLTILFYVFLILLIYAEKSSNLEKNLESEYFGARDLTNFYILIFVLIVLFMVLTELFLIVFFVLFLAFVILGYVIFFYTVIGIVRGRIF